MPPKRHNTDGEDEGRLGKKPRRGNKPEDENVEDEPVENGTPKDNKVGGEEEDEATTATMQRKNAGKFELASGSIDPPKLNVKDPSKLMLHFREVATNHEKTLMFQGKPAEKIDWSNNKDIQMIQKWRRQLLRRQGFPTEREVTAWLSREKAFIELSFRLLQQRLDAGQQVAAPSNPQIADHLNAFFKGKYMEDERGVRFIHRGHRNANMVSTQLRNETQLGKATRATRKVLERDKRGVIDWPGITDQQLDEFMADPNMNLQSLKEPLKAGVSGGAAQPVRSHPLNSPGGTIIESVPSENLGATNTGTDLLPNGRGPHPVRMPTESSTKIDSSAAIDQMIKDGWSFPTITKEINSTDVVEGEADTLNDEWMYKTVDALHDRWRRSARNEFGYDPDFAKSHGWQNYSLVQKRTEWYRDVATRAPKTDILVSIRRPFAQAVNGLLNLATCPPVGYFGDMNSPAVLSVGEWDRFDRAFVHEHQRALRFHRGEHEEKYDRYAHTHKNKKWRHDRR